MMTKEELVEIVRNEISEGISLDQAIYYALGDCTCEEFQEAQKLVPPEWMKQNEEAIYSFSKEYRLVPAAFSLVLWIYDLFGEEYTTL